MRSSIDRTRLAVLAALAMACVSADRAVAADVCVECAEPAATYRCIVALPGDAPLASLTSKAAQVVCMTELAKAGGHGFCRVTQGSVGGLCNGPERVVAFSQSGGAGPATSVNAGPSVGSPDGARAEESQPPQTLADLAKKTAQSSTDEIKKAGQAIKNSADSVGSKIGSAIKCVVTLFLSC
jgi:hypothetical protein